MAEGAGQPSFARAGRARDEQILMALDPFAGREPLEQSAIETAGGTVIDVLRRCLLAQAGEPEAGGQALAVAFQRLALDQHGQPILEAEFGGVGMASLLLEAACHAGEPKLAQAVGGGVGQHLVLLNGSSGCRGCCRAGRAARRARIGGDRRGRGRCAGWTAPSHRFHYRDLITGEKPREIVTIFEFDSDGERNWAVPVHSYRWGPFTDPSGIEHKIYDYPGLVVDPQKWNPNPNVLKNVRIPLRPHFGNLGLTQKEADIVNSIPPDYIGGNVDDWRFGKGATRCITQSPWTAPSSRSATRTRRWAIPNWTAPPSSLRGPDPPPRRSRSASHARRVRFSRRHSRYEVGACVRETSCTCQNGDSRKLMDALRVLFRADIGGESFSCSVKLSDGAGVLNPFRSCPAAWCRSGVSGQG